MLDLRIVAEGRAIPLFDLPSIVGGDVAAREIADQIEGLIAFLDDLGGDVDIEADGDELDGTGGEDDFVDFRRSGISEHPGCPIGDPGEPDDEDCCAARDDEPVSGPGLNAQWVGPCAAGSDEDAEPTAWIEWHTRDGHLLEYEGERLARDRHGNPDREDDEDDDPAGDPCDHGEPDDWRPDGIVLPRPIYGVDQTAGPTNETAAHRAYLQGFTSPSSIRI